MSAIHFCLLVVVVFVIVACGGQPNRIHQVKYPQGFGGNADGVKTHLAAPDYDYTPFYQTGSNGKSTMDYQGGPILESMVVNIIWYGYFTQAKQQIIAQFVSSLSSSNWWNIARQYFSLTPEANVGSITLGQMINITGYPNGFFISDGSNPRYFKVDPNSDLYELIETQLVKSGPRRSNHIWTVITDQFSLAVDSAGFGLCNAYCGFHSLIETRVNDASGVRVPIIYVGSPLQCPNSCGWADFAKLNIPDAGGTSFNLAQLGVDVGYSGTSNSPNGDYEMDTIANILAHEFAETASDLYGNSWWDRSNSTTFGYEIGDECAWSFGKVLKDTTFTPPRYYNEVVGTRKFFLQRNWELTGQKCTNGILLNTSFAVFPKPGWQ